MRELKVQTLELDEFEALRLADAQGLYHADAAKKMGISRQSFGLIIKSARKKVAVALAAGDALAINASEYCAENEAVEAAVSVSDP